MDEIKIGIDNESKGFLAAYSKTPPEMLEKLARDENEYVRMEVAESKNTSTKALEKLSYDENKDVRHCVAHNPNTPPETLAKLADDEWVGVLGGLWQKMKTLHL
ncbi:MAG: hypothetical protein LBT99_03765 [Bifidobacteriaceae bacterium]|jgi:hypothetical protein|nr:hypothetical protein [Bifidobacteriaceae bacterium]